MTPRQFVDDVMRYIREKTSDLSEEEYAEWLEQLGFQIEDERQLLDWHPDYDEE